MLHPLSTSTFCFLFLKAVWVKISSLVCFAISVFIFLDLIQSPVQSLLHLDPINCFVINMWLWLHWNCYLCGLKILIPIHPSLCILTIFPVLAPLQPLLLLSSHPSQHMTADQPTWHSHLAFPSGSKREVWFGHFMEHSNTAWCYNILHCVLIFFKMRVALACKNVMVFTHLFVYVIVVNLCCHFVPPMSFAEHLTSALPVQWVHCILVLEIVGQCVYI